MATSPALSGPPDRPDLDLLPFSVAHPLSYARDEAEPVVKRVQNVIFAAHQAVRTTALLLLSDYLACDTVSHQVAVAIHGLRLPHWKEWIELADRLARFWAGRYDVKPERECSFPALRDAWLQEAHCERLTRTSRAFELLAAPRGWERQKSAIDVFWRVRNRLAHEQGTRTSDDGSETILLGWLMPLVGARAGSWPPGKPVPVCTGLG